MIRQRLLPLYPCIRQLSYLLAVKPLPAFPVKLLVEADNHCRIQKVDKGIPNITLVLEVDRKVEEVELPRIVARKELQEERLVVLVRDVFDHDCSPVVVSLDDLH